jgi:hypothetical protein
MTFYDYDLLVGRDGRERYLLRAGGKRLPDGYFCTVYFDAIHGWGRVTQWGAKPGRRYVPFVHLDQALASGIAWARRREREDARCA